MLKKSAMNNKAKYLVLGLLLLLSVAKSHAQQSVQFTQYIFNMINVNPAYTGYKEEWFGQMAMRNQWMGWEGSPKTGSLSLDGVMDPIGRRHGLGVQVAMDGLGAQSATSVFGSYALRLQLDEDDTRRVQLGIGAGVTQYGLDGNKLSPVVRQDNAIPAGKLTSWKPDIRLGLYYYNPKWYAGVSVLDLFANASQNEEFRFNENALESLYRNISLYFIGGMLFELEEGMHLRPSLLLKEDFRGPTSVDVNAMLIFNNRFWVGMGYRARARIIERDYYNRSPMKLSASNALTAITQFYATDQLRIGYSYDVAMNRVRGLQSGTHEITLGVTLGQSFRQMRSPRYF